jgi:subtilase family serine protease
MPDMRAIDASRHATNHPHLLGYAEKRDETGHKHRWRKFMAEHGDIPTSANPLRTRVVRAAMAVGALVLLVAGAVGVHTLTANAALGRAPNIYPLNYSPSQAAPVPATAQLLRAHDPNAPLTVEFVLRPQNQTGLNNLMAHLYKKGDPLYRHWLTPAQYHKDFPASPFNAKWFTDRGLRQVSTSSPYLVGFTGTTATFSKALGTHFNDYRLKDGRTAYANATPLYLPLELPSSVAGALGTDNIGRAHPESAKPTKFAGEKAKPHYGAGPGGNGLMPSQIRGIYLANPVYHLTNGKGRTLAVYELSEYTHSDIAAYEKQSGIPNVPISNIYVDGGPCNAVALGGQPCSYGASEVELDIELQLALAPGIAKLQVYNGPNSNQGGVDTYFKIANDNTADAISTSWGICEAGSGSGVWNGEFTAFEQMAMQGQSIFSAAGDAGAFDCEHDPFNGPTPPSYYSTLQTDDPSTNPYMTAVGGTSFFSTFDPGTSANPVYPTGKEYVWNTINNCLGSDFIYQGSDLGLCPYGAGGGGNSRIWPKPGYQVGPGVKTGYSKYGAANGKGWCNQPAGVQCREIPDVSIMADPNSGYAIYCTDVGAGCPSSFGYFNGWLQIGGTSAAAPLWASIVGLTDAYAHQRIGFLNFLLYNYNTTNGFKYQFHDIAGGVHYTFNGDTLFTNTNGWYPETANYDLATGMGTPRIYYIVTSLK